MMSEKTRRKRQKVLSTFLSVCMTASVLAGFTITADAESNTSGAGAEKAEVFIKSATAVADVTNKTDFEAALADTTVKTINIVGSITTSTNSVTRDDLKIIVKNGSVLKLSYKTNQTTNEGTICNADITVEKGGKIDFYADTRYDDTYKSWLIMNGDFTLNEGASAVGSLYSSYGRVVFQGKFVNNGTFTNSSSNPVVYLNYGQQGNVIGNMSSTPKYNFCLTAPSQKTLDTNLIQYTAIKGDLKVGSNLHLVVDGFGEVTNDDFCNVNWYVGSSVNSVQENKATYTVPPSAAGKTISSRANGFVSSANSAYLVIGKTGVVKEIFNFSYNNITTSDKVPIYDVVYVGGSNASASNSGDSVNAPIESFDDACAQVKEGGTIVVMGAVTLPVDSSYRYGIYKNITVTGKYNDIVYPDAKLVNIGLDIIGKGITIRDITMKSSGDSDYRGYIYAAENTTTNLINVKKEGTIKFSGNGVRGVKLNVKDCSLNMSTGAELGGELDVTLDNSLLASTFSNRNPIGNVTLKNNSKLITTQPINNITADATDNTIYTLYAASSSLNYPGIINVEGTVEQSAPITLGVMDENWNTVPVAPGRKLLTSDLTNNLNGIDYNLSATDYPGMGLNKIGNDICAANEVTISELTAENSEYNSEAHTGYTGTAVCKLADGTDVTAACGALTYIYEGTGSTVYEKSAAAPTEAGTYKLTVSVPDTASMYTGSLEIPFTISKKPIIVKLKNVSVNNNAALPAWEVDLSGLTAKDSEAYKDSITALNQLLNTDTYISAITVNDAAPKTSSTGTFTVKITQEAIDSLKNVLEGEVTLLTSCYDAEYSNESILSVLSNGGTMLSYTITFNTDGGSKIKNRTVLEGNFLIEPTAPTKDGYVFDGWYTDKDLTTKYNFKIRPTKSFTLYAKWTKEIIDNSTNELILTIGKKEANVFGEKMSNDVAPLIRNDRTMLPARFVAENLGALVQWSQEEEKVTITKDGIMIFIYIGSDKAIVNGKEIELDSPAFIENERTYTPIRFISEQLGATVDWNEAEQKVTITKKD